MIYPKNFLILLLISISYFNAINAVEYLTIYENSLTEAQKTHSIAAALSAIEKSSDRTTIANSITSSMITNYSGSWNVLVTGTNQSGSALKLQVN
jgi:hypothetical protein